VAGKKFGTHIKIGYFRATEGEKESWEDTKGRPENTKGSETSRGLSGKKSHGRENESRGKGGWPERHDRENSPPSTFRGVSSDWAGEKETNREVQASDPPASAFTGVVCFAAICLDHLISKREIWMTSIPSCSWG